jgi:DNA-binding GntR family transcriptional regulator
MPTKLGAFLAPSQKTNLADEIVGRLREAIVNGQLPPGERLREDELAETLGVSRGPIREALVELEREGLVVGFRNKSKSVARLAREDAQEIYTLRLAIERLAIQLAARHAQPDHLAEMQTIINAMTAFSRQGVTEQEAAKLDVDFHDVIYRAAQHKRVYQVWKDIRPQIYIFLLSRNVAHTGFLADAARSHQALLDVIQRRDEAEAVTAIEQHLLVAYERVFKNYQGPAAKAAPADTRLASQDPLLNEDLP